MQDDLTNLATSLYLIRHGESTWNVERRYQGQADPPLSPRGQWQARRAAEALVAVPLSAVYSSPLQRAVDTAQAIAVLRRIEVITLEDLIEVYGGAWQGLTQEEIAEAYSEIAAQRWENTAAGVPPGGETLEDAASRGLRAVQRILADSPQGGVAVVTHGGVAGLILKGLLGASPTSPGRFWLSNGSITLVEFRGGVPHLLRVNDTRHLEAPAT